MCRWPGGWRSSPAGARGWAGRSAWRWPGRARRSWSTTGTGRRARRTAWSPRSPPWAARRWPTTATRPTRPAARPWSRRRWSAGGGWTSAWPTRPSARPACSTSSPTRNSPQVLQINLLGSARLARAAMAVMRPAGFGRIILVASSGGLHGDVGLSAYAASKGGMLALGRTLAAEGEARGVLTNVLLPYALTQMTSGAVPPGRGPADGPGPGGAGADRAGQPGQPAATGSTSSPAEAGCDGHRWWSGRRPSCRTSRIFARISCTPCWPRADPGNRMSTAWRWTRSTT